MSDLLERTRIKIPTPVIIETGRVKKFFEVLPNNSGLTEEYLYTHQPTGRKKIAVYSTSKDPVGYLDDSEDVRKAFVVLAGPAILVARKGYGGRLSVVTEQSFIVHEDGYAISPKETYLSKIDLSWFAGHYSAEFQSHRSSLEGIGDFPRAKLLTMSVTLPRLDWQIKCSKLYKKRDEISEFIKTSADTIGVEVDEILSGNKRVQKVA